MEWILWAACAVLFTTVLVLAVRVSLLRRSAREIAAGLSERISTDTNTLIGISSRDRAMRALAESVNTGCALCAGSAAACSRGTASCARP